MPGYINGEVQFSTALYNENIDEEKTGQVLRVELRSNDSEYVLSIASSDPPILLGNPIQTEL